MLSTGRELDGFLRTCQRLLSARGEANSAAHAATALQQNQHLSEPAQLNYAATPTVTAPSDQTVEQAHAKAPA